MDKVFDFSDKHSPYILAAFGIAGIILCVMVFSSLYKAKAARAALRKFESRT